jgi:hypothetical protein
MGGNPMPPTCSAMNSSMDDQITAALSSYGIITAVYRSQVYFNMGDSFGLYVQTPAVYGRDLIKFQSVLTSVWKSSSRLTAFSNWSLIVPTQEKYFTEDG